MNIRGIVKFTLVDYPGRLACIIFTGGCNFICPYCHNPFLVVDHESQPLINEEDFFTFLSSRVGKLDAVVISGGEPTLQKNLIDFSSKIKEMGFGVKIDTNGSNFSAIKKMHEKNCIDYIGIDYKAPARKYEAVSGRSNYRYIDNLKKTISFVVKNNVPYDIRTTVHKSILNIEDLFTIRKELNSFGIKEWTLQQFNPVEVLDEELLQQSTYSDAELRKITSQMNNTSVRGIGR